MEQFDKYRVKIKIRPIFKCLQAKKEYLHLNDKIIDVEVVWKFEDDDKYSGEFALCPLTRVDKISWIASGDVEILNKIA